MKNQISASYSGKPGIVRLPSIETPGNHPSLCGRVGSISYSISSPNKNKILAPATRQYSIDQQMMSTIKVDIEKMIESGHTFIRNNHSLLIKQVQIQENLIKLQELFLPFARDALGFYASSNSFFEDDKTFMTSASVRSSSFSFLQQWKIVVSIFDSINEKGIHSLLDYINEKFNIIFKGIETVSSKPDKHTILFEKINQSCTILKKSATSLQKLIVQLFENFTDPTSENITYYFSEIKQFLSLYNESFYNVFSKVGFMQQELSDLKSATLTASNDIMNSLRALFSFWPDYKELTQYKDEIQKLLNSAICQMKLPSSLVRIIAPTPLKKLPQEREIEKKLKPEFTKVEQFIASILKAIKKPPLDTKIDLWKRLKTTENLIIDCFENLNSSINFIANGQSHNVQNLLVEAESRKKEIENLKKQNESLLEENQELHQKLDEANNLTKKMKEKIELLENNSEKLREKEVIEKVLLKLNDMLKRIDPNISKIDCEIDGGQNDNNGEEGMKSTSLEKLNIFVLEKKCSKCRENEQQRKEITKLLSTLGKIGQGDSLPSIIQSIIKKQEKLETENNQLQAAYNDTLAQLQKVEEATKMLLGKSAGEESSSSSADKKGGLRPNKASNNLLESFRNIEDQFKSDIKTIQDELNDSHARELNTIVGMFDDVISDTEDDAVNDSTRNGSEKDGKKSDSNNEKGGKKSDSSNEKDGKKSKSSNEKNGKKSNSNSKSDENSAKESKGDENEENSKKQTNDSEINSNPATDKKSYAIKSASQNPTVNSDSEIKKIVMAKVKKAASKIESLQKTIDKNNELLEKVKCWMRLQVNDVDVDGLDFSQSIPLLMNAIDNKSNPLQPALDRLEKNERKIANQCRAFVDNLSQMKYVKPIDTTRMSVFELLNSAEREVFKLNKQLEKVEVKADSNNLEIESARDSMQTIAERLLHLLQRDNVDFNGMDMNGLLYEISNYIEELISGGNKNLFIPVADLNDMSKKARKNSKFQNSSDPKMYLPELFEKFCVDTEIIRVIKLFEEPLETIFKKFDFQLNSFDPNKQSFKYLREKIFQLHLIFGKDENAIGDSKVSVVIKRFISLASTLFSYIASSFLGAKERELAYSQNLKRDNI